MIDKQPEALRLAELLENEKHVSDLALSKIAAELRRLHEVNAELVKALQELLFEEETQDNGLTEAVIMSHDEFVKFMRESVRSYESAKERARDAIRKATGEQQ
jgi:hypothetical protein